MPRLISRAAYAAMYGPTTGDRVRLADTDLVIEVEQDLRPMVKRQSSVAAKCCAMGWDNLNILVLKGLWTQLSPMHLLLT
jgi:hypothetical protein